MNKILLIAALGLSIGLDARAQSASPFPEPARDEKSREEYRRKVAEVEEKNRRIAETNRKVKQALADGAKAYEEKNYRLALEKFDEGYNLNPVYWGTAPVMLNNKAMALIQLGVENYNEAVKTKRDSKLLESNRFFLDAIGYLKLSREILISAPSNEDEAGRAQIELTRYVCAKELAQAFRLLVLTDETRIREAIEAFADYLRLETDPLLKEQAEKHLRNLKSKLKTN